VARSLSLDEFEAGARELVAEVAAGGEVLLIEEGGRPLAMLAAHGRLPGWEGWMQEMRAAFPSEGARIAQAPSAAGPAPPDPEVFDKSLLGFEPGTGVVGSSSGREFLAGSLRRLSVPVTDDKLLDAIYAAVLQLCEDKEHVYDRDLRVLAQELISEAPQRLRLLAVTFQSTTGLPATAEVTLELGGGPAMRRELGDGPLDAAFNAIEKLTGMSVEVEDFTVISATKGRDAMAEAFIQLNHRGVRVVGAGASTNAIEAGVHAYLNALNFLYELDRNGGGAGEVEPG
jgi:antitoxin (DNA-binding transcriptional repressor) of toxin-antitoxin stability system